MTQSKTARELADDYSNNYSTSYDSNDAYYGYVNGFEKAVELMKEYLFNTEQHQDKDNPIYISEEYLKQTIKFLNWYEEQ